MLDLRQAAAIPLLGILSTGCGEGEPCDDVLEDCGPDDRCVPGTDPVDTPATYEVRDHFVRLDLSYQGCMEDELAVWWSGVWAPSDPPGVPLELQHHRGDCSTQVSRSIWIDLWELHRASREWSVAIFLRPPGDPGSALVAGFPYAYEGPPVTPPEGEVLSIDPGCGLIR